MLEVMAEKLIKDLELKGFLTNRNDDHFITNKGLLRIDELLAQGFDFKYANKPMSSELRLALLEKDKNNLKNEIKHPVEQLLTLEIEMKTALKLFSTSIKNKEILQ